MAAVLYRCLAGRPPHCGSSVTEILVKLVKEPVPVLNVAGVPKPLCATIDRALARDPHRRYPSMSAFVHALKAAAGLESVEIGTEVLPVVVLGSLASSSNGPTDAQDTSLSEALDLPSREVSLLSKGSASEHDAGRRTRIRGAIALGALLAVGAVWLARNGHPAQVTPAAELRADVRRSPGSQPALLVAVPRPQSSAEPQSTAAAVEGSSVESRSAHARASAGPRTRSELPQAFKALLTKAPPRKRISATTLASEAPSSPEPARAQTAERERTTGLPVATEW
jgi:serine/threonine protein kinase